MSEERFAVEGLEKVRNIFELEDICVQKVFAFDFEEFLDVAQFTFPSVICNCIVENVIVTSRNIFFNCDDVCLCIEYNVCIKFFPKVGDPFCQTFQACFTKCIPFTDFFNIFGFPITLEEFLTAEGACVIAEPFFFDCFVDNEVCQSFVDVFVCFFIVVKLWRERNVLVIAIPFLEDFPTEKQPKVVNSCGLPNLAIDGNNGPSCSRSAERMAKLPAAKKEQLEKVMTEKKAELEKKFGEIKNMMGK